jgi:hypothetical protein
MDKDRKLVVLPELDESLMHDISYEVGWLLANGSWVKMLIFDRRQQRWIFEYDYREYPVGVVRGRPDLVNEVCFVVDYFDGLVISCALTMHVIFPARLGKVYAYGVDISPNAKTYFQFHYQRQVPPDQEDEFFFQLVELEIGCGKVIDLRPKTTPQDGALIVPVEFPFPVCDRIAAEYGQFKVPFFDNERTEQHFVFPRSIVKISSPL